MTIHQILQKVGIRIRRSHLVRYIWEQDPDFFEQDDQNILSQQLVQLENLEASQTELSADDSHKYAPVFEVIRECVGLVEDHLFPDNNLSIHSFTHDVDEDQDIVVGVVLTCVSWSTKEQTVECSWKDAQQQALNCEDDLKQCGLWPDTETVEQLLAVQLQINASLARIISGYYDKAAQVFLGMYSLQDDCGCCS